MKYLLFSLAIVPLLLAALADAYTIDGTTVSTYVACAEYGRSVVYVLTATDTQAHTYDLGLDTTGLMVAHTGAVDVDGDRLIWLGHRAGEQATVSIGGGPCDDPVPRLSPLYRYWTPWVFAP
jgi:hypothetical protein